MKCRHVESIIVEYAEGALCVADELCVDIHLVQCESCRTELRGIARLAADVAVPQDSIEPPPDVLALLERIDRLPSKPPRRDPVSALRTGGSMLRAVVVTAIVFLAITTGAVTWHRETPHAFGLHAVEPGSELTLMEALRPLASPAERDQLRDLGDVTGAAPAPRPAS